MHQVDEVGVFAVTFDPTITTDIQALVRQLGSVPIGDLLGPRKAGYRYGYIGTKALMMYSLITPGAVVLIDERQKVITAGPWRRESDRPIYFLETYEGFACCWCAIEGGSLILQPHPISHEHPRILARKEVDLIGQIAAVAMRLETPDKSTRNP